MTDKPEGELRLTYPHVFYATRKGTPKGQPCPALKYCDECGGTLDEPQHKGFSQHEADKALLRAIDGEEPEL